MFYRNIVRSRFPRLLSSGLRYRGYASPSFSKILSVPFKASKKAAQEAFTKHHTKDILRRLPTSYTPNPTPYFLPYYLFSGTSSVTFSAEFDSIKRKRSTNSRDDILETEHHNISRRTLS